MSMDQIRSEFLKIQIWTHPIWSSNPNPNSMDFKNPYRNQNLTEIKLRIQTWKSKPELLYHVSKHIALNLNSQNAKFKYNIKYLCKINSDLDWFRVRVGYRQNAYPSPNPSDFRFLYPYPKLYPFSIKQIRLVRVRVLIKFQIFVIKFRISVTIDIPSGIEFFKFLIKKKKPWKNIGPWVVGVVSGSKELGPTRPITLGRAGPGRHDCYNIRAAPKPGP